MIALFIESNEKLAIKQMEFDLENRNFESEFHFMHL
jgi:hypothetical protein